MLTSTEPGRKIETQQRRHSGLGQVVSLSVLMAVPIAFAVWTNPAQAQTEEGHTDGGHTDGGGDEGGGKGGHGAGGHGGHGGHGETVDPEMAVKAPDAARVSGGSGAGRAIPGTYFRAEMGVLQAQPGSANWLPPGYPSDPQVFFDLGSDNGGFAGLAIGYDWSNGLRGEVEMLGFGSTQFSGPWSYTVPETSGPHASVRGSVRSVALMGNLFYEPFRSSTGKVVPYVMAGIGMANNRMSDWTRINPDEDRTERSFAGASRTDLALAVGFGVSMEIGKTRNGAPMTFELGYRYFDLGTAQGDSTPLPGSGSGGVPVQALRLDQSDQVITVGIRIPL